MEKLLNSLNGFGLFQKLLLFLIGIINIVLAISCFGSIFTNAEHKIICINKDDNTMLFNTKDLNNCDRWETLRGKTDIEKQNITFDCRLDHSFYGKTMIDEWGFQCKHIRKASLVTSVYMASMLFTFVGGYIGDKYGRRKICILAAMAMSFASVSSEILMTKFGLDDDIQYIVFIVAQFIIGLSGNCLFCAAVIILCEFTSLKYHTLVSTINMFIYVIGELVLPLIYYITYDWHGVNTAIGIFSTIITVLILTLLPESPRFLIANKRYDECFELLNKIAKINKRSDKMFTRDQFFKQIESNENGTVGVDGSHINFHEIQSLLSIRVKSKNILQQNNDIEAEIIEKNTGSVFFFLINPIKNFFTTLMMSLIWISIALVYYGISLGITSLSDSFNPYIIYVLSCVAEMVGIVLCFLNDKFSRKVMIILFIVSAGILSFLTVVMPHDVSNEITWKTYLIIAFALVGRVNASSAMCSGYVYTVRMFPPSVRGTLFTICLSIAKLGSLAAPVINTLWKPLPHVIFSGSTVLAAIFLIILPDPSNLY